MNKWLKIRENIYKDKLEQVEGLFLDVTNNVEALPRTQWTAPLENWTNNQLRGSPLKLSLQEYSHLKDIVNNFSQNLIFNPGNENQIINEFKKEFTDNYLKILKLKEADIKLEVTANLIEEKNFPICNFSEWYLSNYKLSQDKFNEALGEFWGDVWKHAASGGLAGAAVGGIPTGGMGTFAGAGLGALAGGLYGAGKNVVGNLFGSNKPNQPQEPQGENLLRTVWNWKKKQNSFEQNKEKALTYLKRLKELSGGFDLHPNFISTLDSMIEQLGTVRAYRIAPNKVSRHEQPTEEPQQVAAEPPQPEKAPEPAATVAPPQPEKTPEPPAQDSPTPEEISREREAKEKLRAEKEAKDAAARLSLHQSMRDEEKARLAREAERKQEAEKKRLELAKAAEEDEKKKAALIAANTEINTPEDIVKIYKKAKENKDLDALARIGVAIHSMGIDTEKEMDEMKIEDFKKALEYVKSFTHASLKDAAQDSIDLADKYAQRVEQNQLNKGGTPEEIPVDKEAVDKPTELLPDMRLRTMETEDFRNYVKKLGLGEFLKTIKNVGGKGTPKRKEVVDSLKFYFTHPEHLTDPNEQMPETFKEKVQYYKRLLQG